MIFGKHINKYYLKYGWMILLGLIALISVDFGQLKIPELYRMAVNGLNSGMVDVNGVMKPFDMDFLLDEICLPLCIVIVMIVAGRFLWRIGFFGSAIKVEQEIRFKMFDRCKDLSQQYYAVNKVGNLMSLFTNDIDTIRDCFGNGILTFADAVIMGGMAFVKMFRMNMMMTAFSMIPMVFLFIAADLVGKKMSAKWRERQELSLIHI